MIDIKFIRENPEVIKLAAKNKNSKVDVDKLIDLDVQRRQVMQKLEGLQAQRNTLAKESAGDKPNDAQIKLGKDLKSQAEILEQEYTKIDARYQGLLNAVPNIPSEDTPIGKDESENQVLRKWGEQPKFDFDPKEHWQIGQDLGVLDQERAAKVTGARFNYIKGGLARLQFALIQFCIDILTDEVKIKEIVQQFKLDLDPRPFTLVIPPVFIRPEVMHKMARLEPREERYHTAADDLYLIGSAEHTLGAMHMNETLTEKQLPLRYLAYSVSFRREAGSYGKDTKGMFRNHQFDKLEMESFTTPEDSLKEQDFLVAIQEYMMQQLEIPYEVMICCTGDMGTPDARHIDLNSWLPGQGKYRETHSADLMTDYQSRRLNTKVKRKDGSVEFVHMNDATAIAMSRTPIAILENHQQKDGSVNIPKVLQKYYGAEKL